MQKELFGKRRPYCISMRTCLMKRICRLDFHVTYTTFICCSALTSKKTVLTGRDLLERVATHKQVYFATTWASYETARQGSLKLVLPVRVNKEMENDYKQMEDMIFGRRPTWDQILKVIADFEHEFNSQK